MSTTLITLECDERLGIAAPTLLATADEVIE
jgi:hypothetical protein